MLAFLAASRLLLLAWMHGRVTSVSDIATVLLSGVRMDLIALCYVLAPAVLLTLALGGRHRLGRIVGRSVSVYLTAIAVMFIFLELATVPFINEYDSRPNRLFIEYLVHPREVIAMLAQGYVQELASVAVGVPVGAVVAWRFLNRVSVPQKATRVIRRVGILAALGPLLFLGARSTLQHRPANPSSVVFSTDHLLNDLCLNSLYSVAYAASQMRGEADASEVYGRMLSDDETVSEVVRSMTTVEPKDFVEGLCPTLHKQTASASPSRPLNLVIILEESLGAQYVGALGGRPVTRYLDTLRERGWWFEQMYATGTRSVRGIEAVVSGFLPTPGRSVVKLGLSQTNFFTLAGYLGDKGYKTQFVYGGESHFDNMKSFFTGNGFQEIIDHDDFASPLFDGSWGVCDEDVLMRAHQSYLEAGDEPFFSLVFSVSNHSPWEYPLGRVEPYNKPAATVENTVRYADHALERFFKAAENAPYWENTIFVVVADHDSRVHGASLVPVERFHIPAVIIGPGIDARSETRITSQIDLPPTLLSLIGVSGVHPMIGHDLTRLPSTDPGRAIMQYGGNQAFRSGNDLLVMQPHLEPLQFRIEGSELKAVSVDAQLRRRALAHALLPSLMYRSRSYSCESALEGSQGTVASAR